MQGKDDQYTRVCRQFEVAHPADRVTATELIDGVRHLLVLEQDDTGCYREVILEPLAVDDRPSLLHAV